jgi:hypothetical protein
MEVQIVTYERTTGVRPLSGRPVKISGLLRYNFALE